MKLLISTTILTLSLFSSAHAQEVPDSCAAITALAEDIMIKRQVNYDIMLLINTLNNELNDQPELLTVMQPIIDMAYSQASATTAQARDQQVEDFKSVWTKRCIADASH